LTCRVKMNKYDNLIINQLFDWTINQLPVFKKGRSGTWPLAYPGEPGQTPVL